MTPLERYIDLFEHLTPADVERFESYFAARARFQDPFNDVTGITAIQQVFRHMFATLEQPAFTVTHAAQTGLDAFLRWQFEFRLRGRHRQIIGVSHVAFDTDERVAAHIDYWDPAAQLYEQLPLLGPLLRGIKHKLAATPSANPSRPAR